MAIGYGIEEELTKDYILKYVSQKEIFEHFLGVNVVIGRMFCSPLRRDRNPTCNFSWKDGVLYYRDWAEPKPKDCFSLVQQMYNCNYFHALEVIKRECIVGKSLSKPRSQIEIDKVKSYSTSKKSIIRIKFSEWKKEVVDYLTSYYINSHQCDKFGIRPIDHVWVNDGLIWTYKRTDPALAYYFGKSDGEEKWKIYFFKRDTRRFLTNTNRINGWVQLPEKGENLIITKSLKDVVCLDTLGYPAIAMQNETTIPYDYIIEEMEQRFENIYSFYDFDYTGVVNAQRLKRLYGIPSIFLTNGKLNTYNYEYKDISDYIRAKGITEGSNFLQCIN